MFPIYVKSSDKYGRGVYAARDIKKGELIEQAPVIVSSHSERKYLDKTIVADYFFNWGKHYKQSAIALGYGSIYNHSYTPAAIFENNLANESIDFYAIRDIMAGEEITINYNGDPDDKTPLWFDVI